MSQTFEDWLATQPANEDAVERIKSSGDGERLIAEYVFSSLKGDKELIRISSADLTLLLQEARTGAYESRGSAGGVRFRAICDRLESDNPELHALIKRALY
jgi:hypothetical protein